jgi:hypothetical protein
MLREDALQMSENIWFLPSMIDEEEKGNMKTRS